MKLKKNKGNKIKLNIPNKSDIVAVIICVVMLSVVVVGETVTTNKTIAKTHNTNIDETIPVLSTSVLLADDDVECISKTEDGNENTDKDSNLSVSNTSDIKENENTTTEIITNNNNNLENSEATTKNTYNYLLDISNPDYTYTPHSIQLSNTDRELAAKVVMGEFGNGGYTACCLIAQCIRDAMIKDNYNSVEEIINVYQYLGFNTSPNQDCYDAVDYIFYSGGLAVPHRVLFMYAPNITSSSWHESQNFVVQYKNVRFFDMW